MIGFYLCLKYVVTAVQTHMSPNKQEKGNLVCFYSNDISETELSGQEETSEHRFAFFPKSYKII